MLIYYTNHFGYNEPWLLRTDLAGPELFVITEFNCSLIWGCYAVETVNNGFLN